MTLAAGQLVEVTAAPSWQSAPSAPSVDSYESTEVPPKAVSVYFPAPRMHLAASIQVPNRIYQLRGAFMIDVDRLRDGVIFVTHRKLPVHGYGQSYAEAYASFCESFDMQWRNLVEEDVVNLTPGGVLRREELESVVEHVMPLNEAQHGEP